MAEPVDLPARRSRGESRSAQDVAEHLRQQIQQGEWAPGEWLREARLCSEFDVGRSVIRRALHHLAQDGLVEIEPNRGAVIKVTRRR